MENLQEKVKKVQAQLQEKQNMYIDGEWVDSASGATREMINPATEEVIATVADGNESDAAQAVEAAYRSFYQDGWSESYARDRANKLFALANLLEERVEEFAIIETLNAGKVLDDAIYDIYDAVNQLRYYGGLATKPNGQTFDVPDNVQTMVIAEPVGVVGAIVPWNYPLLMAMQKLAPAIAAGCSIVIKPAETTPLTLIKFFELIDEVGFPKGTVNLILGDGASAGAEITRHPKVDKVTFTGGNATGKKIIQASADTIKKVSLELGGKSPLIIFDDADFEAAVDHASFAIFSNQGQVCSAGSRLILHESLHDRFMEALVALTKKIKVGNGLAKETDMGPLISKEHFERVLSYIEIGKNEGAELVCGGNPIDGKGYYLEPTIFTNTTPAMRIVKEEIFGPVLVVQTFKTEEEAIALANDSIYGLAGGVFTNDSAKAMRVIKKVRAGITWINTYHNTYNEAPWGGYKQSGIGRDLGTYGLDQYLEYKQINMSLNVAPSNWIKNRD